MATTSSNTCDDCRKVFPILQSTFVGRPPQCPKCQQLEAHRPGSDQHRKIMEFPQCAVCGDSWRNMPLPGDDGIQTCGRNICVEHLSSLASNSGGNTGTGTTRGRPGANQSDAQQQRNSSLFDKLKSGVANNSNGGTQFNSASLDQRSTQLKDLAASDRKNFITVSLEIHFTNGANAKKSSVNDRYGSSKRAFPPDATLIGELPIFLIVVTLSNPLVMQTFRTGVSPSSISCTQRPRETSRSKQAKTSLRLTGNQQIEEGVMGFQLRRYKNKLIEQGFLDEAGCWVHKKGKGAVKNTVVAGKPALLFELFIFFDMYQKRMDLLAEAAGEGVTTLSSKSKVAKGSGSGKRHERTGSAAATESVSKRQRNVGVSAIQSEFALSNRRTSYASTPSSRTKLQKIACALVTAQGQPVFENKEAFHGYISSESFASGLTKCAFELLVPHSDQQFVVKRFYVKLTQDNEDDLNLISALLDDSSKELKIPPTPFTAEEHNIQIEAECVALHLGARFLAEFFKFCKSKNVRVFEHLRFEDAFLLQEVEGAASPASGMPQDVDPWGFKDITPSVGFMWLAEKKHIAGRVVRYNGTLAHPSAHTDLAHLTVYAFIHFVFGHTNGKLIFADVQGTPALFELENGKTADGFTLFDPMIHSMTGNFGVGDHGQVGISKFLEQHECRDICTLLGLHDAVPLELVCDDKGGEEGERGSRPGGSRHSSGFPLDYTSSSGSESDVDDDGFNTSEPKKQAGGDDVEGN
ncbi:kinase-like protein [Coprinellus micaceus]|uniref:Kinase-like protein n=1 Tax=Coprinellus micaceus TaxID=71717 RepID=A0A4Y7T572_COPMI|nr:kinase-like protein [Coprinellus micaceus]